MSSVVVPNITKAVIELLKGNAAYVSTEQAALVATLKTRVSATRMGYEWDDAWVIAATGRIHPAIVVTRTGGIGPDMYIPYAQGRVQVRCYASYFHTALEAATLVQQILLPIAPGIGGWTAGSTQVASVTGVADPLEGQDPEYEHRRWADVVANLYYSRIAKVAA